MSGEYTALAKETAATIERLSKETGKSVSEVKCIIMDQFLANQAQDDKPPAMTDTAQACVWKYDDIHDCYETACQHAYCLVDGTLEENKHRYCPYCGKKIHEVK